MADKRPKRQRIARSCTFFDASLLHREEVELRKALNASLKEARNAQQKQQEEPVEPTVETRSICTNTETRIRIKKSRGIKLKKCSKSDSLEKKKSDIVEEESELSSKSSEVLTKSLKRKCDSAKSKKVENRGFLSKEQQRKELQSPEKSKKVVKTCKKRELKIVLHQGKTTRKSHTNKKVNDAKKSKVVKSLTEKFSTVSKDKKHPSTTCSKRKQESKGQSLIDTCSDHIKKRKTTSQNAEVAKAEEISHSVEESTGNTADNISELKRQVSSALQGKLRKRLKHKLKDRKLVNPLGEIYIPANVAKTEDFLTFLCLRGSASLPRSFEVFNNPDPFFTQPVRQFPDDVFSCPMLHTQSSVTYSPPLSSAPSESSAASPMSSIDGWLIHDD